MRFADRCSVNSPKWQQKENVGTLCPIKGEKIKSGDKINEKAIDSDANTSGPSTQTKETMPQGSETVQTAKVCVFQSNWLRTFPWLRVDNTKDKMFCDICIKHKKNNTLTDGSSNFRNIFHWFTVHSTEYKVCTLVLFFLAPKFWPMAPVFCWTWAIWPHKISF